MLRRLLSGAPSPHILVKPSHWNELKRGWHLERHWSAQYTGRRVRLRRNAVARH
jgi:hypothetical protein